MARPLASLLVKLLVKPPIKVSVKLLVELLVKLLVKLDKLVADGRRSEDPQVSEDQSDVGLMMRWS